ncbi:undecaprenyl/decaprenyl-phosphate alpha-N-acetylglucosaminyl 1-phosphate transferase [bacterium]|nr:undecaprenyl/decaprenyl-phosphate alpha-N-acetylglucosaminyl 1-phosphate transferase [bacterium]
MWNWVYVYIFCFSLILSLAFTPLVRRVAIRFSLLDRPQGRKLHLTAKPLLGGVAIYLAFTLTILANLAVVALLRQKPQLMNLLPQVIGNRLAGVAITHQRLLAILLGGTFILILGLLDDLKEVSPKIKLMGQFLISFLLILFGIKVTLFLPSFLAIPITIIWVVGITNSLNLLDNMDGLAAGVAAIASIIFFSVALQQGQFFVSAILLVFAGSLLGFLPYNFHPATIFMGDAGSMFIGFILATLTVLSTYYTEASPTPLPLIMPLLILGVPLFDTFSVILIRWRRGDPIFGADKRHFSHRLVGLGLTQRQAVLLVYLATFCVGINATLLKSVKIAGGVVILVQALAIFGLIIFLEVAGSKGNQRE